MTVGFRKINWKQTQLKEKFQFDWKTRDKVFVRWKNTIITIALLLKVCCRVTAKQSRNEFFLSFLRGVCVSRVSGVVPFDVPKLESSVKMMSDEIMQISPNK